MILLAFKFVALFIAILYGISITIKSFRGQTVNEYLLALFSLGVTSFIIMQWLL